VTRKSSEPSPGKDSPYAVATRGANGRKIANGRMDQPPADQPQDPISANIIVDAKSQAAFMDQFAPLLEILTRIGQFEFPNPLERSYAALREVVKFVDSNLDRSSRGLTGPLHALINALSDTLKGGRPEMLRPQRRQKGPPKDQSFASVQGTLAAMLDVLIRVGVPSGSAARNIAKQAKSFKIFDRYGQPIAANEIISWRSRVDDGLPADATKVFKKLARHDITDPAEAKRKIRETFEVLANRGHGRDRNSK
jgi:hypothetical protein